MSLRKTSFRAVPGAQRGGILFQLAFIVFFMCFLFFLYLVRHPLLRLAGDFWIVDDPPSHADAIVMLGDDNYTADRAARAAQLYRAGWAPRIVASGRYLRPYASIAELEEHDLTDRGVPRSAVIRFAHHAEDTLDETAALNQLIASRGWKRLILVTSNYHTRRSRYLAEREFPSGTMLWVEAAPDSDFDPRDWWRTRTGIKIFAHECVGMLVAVWESRRQGVQASESTLTSGARQGVGDM